MCQYFVLHATKHNTAPHGSRSSQFISYFIFLFTGFTVSYHVHFSLFTAFCLQYDSTHAHSSMCQYIDGIRISIRFYLFCFVTTIFNPVPMEESEKRTKKKYTSKCHPWGNKKSISYSPFAEQHFGIHYTIQRMKARTTHLNIYIYQYYYRLIQLIEVSKHLDRPLILLICAALSCNWFVSVQLFSSDCGSIRKAHPLR